jgi:hypothetical protein
MGIAETGSVSRCRAREQRAREQVQRGGEVIAGVVVSGALANKATNGGEAWVRLSYVLGFRRLGFDVTFVEQIDHDACTEAAYRYFDDVISEFGLVGSAALVDEHGQPVSGLPQGELLAIAEEADLLVNVSGNLRAEPLLARFRRRAFVDIDPGFTQFWQATGLNGACLRGHDVYFTIGENIGHPECPIPTCGIDWQPTRPPVVLGEWPTARSAFDRFTTVGSWRGPYGPVEFEGRTYGLKAHEFRKFVDLPMRAGHNFELALAIDPADIRDRELLESHGWRLVDPRALAGTPESFRDYVQSSGAEFSVAQGIYVDTESGWFSDRTVRYLASGKPALVQDTGFSRNLPAGEGLIAFNTLEEAVAGAKRIASDYEAHCAAAGELAQEYFDSDAVLSRLLETAGVRS